MLSVPSTPRACACVRACVRARVRACVRARVSLELCARTRACACSLVSVCVSFPSGGVCGHVRRCVGVGVRVHAREAVRAHCMTAFTSNGMGHGQPAGSSTKVGKPESGAMPTHGASPYLHGMCTTHGHADMHTRIQDRAQAGARVHTQTHAHTHSHTRTRTLTYTHTHTHTNAHTHTRTHTQKDTHTHTHFCATRRSRVKIDGGRMQFP